MKTWDDLDKDFTQLAARLRHSRIDYQWGRDGDRATLRNGGDSGEDIARFEHLAAIAGKKLSDVSAKRLHPEVMRPGTPAERWRAALRHESGLLKLGHTVESEREGVRQPTTFNGSIHDPANASATLALKLSHMPRSWRALAKSTPAIVIAAVGVVAGVVTIVHNLDVKWWWEHDAPTATVNSPPAVINAVTSSAPTVLYYRNPLTLKTIFDTDFPSNFTLGGIARITTASDHADTFVPWLIVVDFTARVKFLAYYIPRTNHAFAICNGLVTEYQKTLSDADKNTLVTAQIPGETAPTKISEMQFSGRIYFYTEADFSLQEAAALERAYLQRGLSVEFRGAVWRTLHWEEKRAMTSKDAQVQQNQKQ